MAVEIARKAYWSAVGCKLVETFISVKLWILAIAILFALKLVLLFSDIKEVILQMVLKPTPETAALVPVLCTWSEKLIDNTLAMFISVIVVVVLSREIFKDAKISKSYGETGAEKSEDQIKSQMV